MIKVLTNETDGCSNGWSALDVSWKDHFPKYSLVWRSHLNTRPKSDEGAFNFLDNGQVASDLVLRGNQNMRRGANEGEQNDHALAKTPT